MKIETTCKFCRRPIVLTCTDEEADNDLAKRIIGFAMHNTACNRCADFFTLRNKLTDAIKAVAEKIMVRPPDEQVKARLFELLKKYAVAIARYNHMPELSAWNDSLGREIAEWIMREPRRWIEILKAYRDQARKQMNEQRELAV